MLRDKLKEFFKNNQIIYFQESQGDDWVYRYFNQDLEKLNAFLPILGKKGIKKALEDKLKFKNSQDSIININSTITPNNTPHTQVEPYNSFNQTFQN